MAQFTATSVIALAARLEKGVTDHLFQIIACVGLSYHASLTDGGENAKATKVQKSVRKAFLRDVFKSESANNYKLCQYAFAEYKNGPKPFAREYPSLDAAVGGISTALRNKYGTVDHMRAKLFPGSETENKTVSDRVMAQLANATKGDKPALSQGDLQTLLRKIMVTCLKPQHLANVAAVVASLERDYRTALAKDTPDHTAQAARFSGKTLGAKAPAAVRKPAKAPKRKAA